MLNKARHFAITAHTDQKYGDHPYSVHLDAVVQHLTPYGETAQIIGYLHDVIEDTDISYDDIKHEFGIFIADCVAILTDENGSNRTERKEKTYAKMSNIHGDFELALTVKAADRLANLQACIQNNNQRLLGIYLKEHPTFTNSAYRQGNCEELWKQIEKIINSIA
ncbi:MAG: HD domain-containing protein [Alphaproteobacteria bacterium]